MMEAEIKKEAEGGEKAAEEAAEKPPQRERIIIRPRKGILAVRDYYFDGKFFAALVVPCKRTHYIWIRKTQITDGGRVLEP